MATAREREMLAAYYKYAQKSGKPISRQGFEAFAKKYMRSATSGSVGPAPGNYTVQPSTWMTGSYDDSAMAPKTAGSIGADFFKYQEALKKEQRAAVRREKEYRRKRKDAKSADIEKSMRGIAKEVNDMVKNQSEELPGNFFEMTPAERRTWKNEWIRGTYANRKALAKEAQAVMDAESPTKPKPSQKTKKERYGGGTIKVTGDKVGGKDAEKGTIAITGGNPDQPKQWIFEPAEPVPEKGEYRGRYIAKRRKPGTHNEWESGGEINSHDLYVRTNGRFGSEGSFDENRGEEDITAEDFGVANDVAKAEQDAVSLRRKNDQGLGNADFGRNPDIGYPPGGDITDYEGLMRNPEDGEYGSEEMATSPMEPKGVRKNLEDTRNYYNKRIGSGFGLSLFPRGDKESEAEPEQELTPEEADALEEEELMRRREWAKSQEWGMAPDNYGFEQGGDYDWY
jgi:hypothetical protein